MKKKLIVAFLLFIFNINVFALTYGGCEYSEVARMKSLVNNVNIYYDYYLSNGRAYFNVTLTNLTPEIRFTDNYNDKTYSYSDTNNGELVITGYSIQSGSYRFFSANDKCLSVKLGTKYYSFPIYNVYYGSELCKDIPESALCQKWVKNYYSSEQFEKAVKEYKEYRDNKEEKTEEIAEGLFDIIIKFYIKYYYLILIPVILICSIVIYIDRRRYKL